MTRMVYRRPIRASGPKRGRNFVSRNVLEVKYQIVYRVITPATSGMPRY